MEILSLSELEIGELVMVLSFVLVVEAVASHVEQVVVLWIGATGCRSQEDLVSL